MGGSSATTPLRSASDGTQSSSSFHVQGKAKKREHEAQGFESTKKERVSPKDDSEFENSTNESFLKSEIMKITDKGRLVDIEGVEKLIQVIQHDRGGRKMDPASRSLFVDVIASSENIDCLSRFVKLRGLHVLDEWLHEALKDGDKSAEDFLLILLGALDKLPVNINALQTCSVGKSVNHLRAHRNPEIQKKARVLISIWKKCIEDEMNSRNSSSQTVSWTTRAKTSAITSESALRNSVIQPATYRAASVKPLQGNILKPASVDFGHLSAPASLGTCSKEGQFRVSVEANTSDQSQLVINGGKSSCFSESSNKSFMLSSGLPKNIFSNERSSFPFASLDGKNVLDGSSSQRGSVNGLPGVPWKTASSRSFLPKNPAERSLNGILPASEGRFQKFMVKLPDQGRSLKGSAGEGSLDGPRIAQGSYSQEQPSHDSKVNCSAFEENNAVLIEELEGSNLKGEASGSGEGIGSATTIPDAGIPKAAEVPKTISYSEDEIRSAKFPDFSCRSANASLEISSEYPNSSLPSSPDDDVNMNHLMNAATELVGCSTLKNTNSTTGELCSDKPKTEHHEDEACQKHNPHCNVLMNNVELHGVPLNEVSENENTSKIGEKTSGEIASSGAELPGTFGSSLELHEKSDNSCSEQKVIDNEDGLQDNDGSRFSSEEDINLTERNSDKEKGDSFPAADKANTSENSDKEKGDSSPAADKANTSESEGSSVDGDTGSDVNPNKETCEAVIKEGGTSAHFESLEKCKEMLLSHDTAKISDPDDAVGNDEKNASSLSSYPEKQESEQCKTFPLIQHIRGNSKNKEVTEEYARPDGEEDGMNDAPSLLETGTRINFDLNEGLNVDEGKYAKPAILALPSNTISPFELPVSTHPFGFPFRLKVTAAAKGPFLPPDDLLISKGEHGWKGSAATSAFRPAEPRKLVEMPAQTVLTSSSACTHKRDHSVLEIDLNEPHEENLEEFSSTTPGGLDLDLNLLEEETDFGQCSTNKIFAPDAPLRSAKPSKNGIDLNNGPGIDKASIESMLLSQHACCSIPSQTSIGCLRMNDAEIGNYSSWLPPGAHPSFFPEHQFPLVEPHRILTAEDNTTLGSFHYPMFPFGTGFSLPAASSTNYIDSGRLCFPGVNGSISSQLSRPYTLRTPEPCGSDGVRQSLDLNAGPGVNEVEGRGEMLPFTSRSFPTGTSQVLDEHTRMYQATGRGLKRNNWPSNWL